MTLVANNKTIPTNGDYVIGGSNNTKVTKVVATNNGVSKTVWEKLVESIILNDSTTRIDPPGYSSTYDRDDDDLTVTVTREDTYYWSSYAVTYGIWRNEDGSVGGVWEESGWYKEWETTYQPYCSNKLKAIRSFDVTNYKYCTVTVAADILQCPSGNISNFETVSVGFSETCRVAVANRWMAEENSGIGSFDTVYGPCYEPKAGFSADAEGKINFDDRQVKYADVTINISSLTGVQTLRCYIRDSPYRNGGWCRIKKIKLHN